MPAPSLVDGVLQQCKRSALQLQTVDPVQGHSASRFMRAVTSSTVRGLFSCSLSLTARRSSWYGNLRHRLPEVGSASQNQFIGSVHSLALSVLQLHVFHRPPSVIRGVPVAGP